MAFRSDDGPGVDAFRPTSGPARWVTALMMATLLLAAVAGAMSMKKLELLGGASVGDVSAETLEAYAGLEALRSLFELVVVLATGVAFALWFYRAHKNLAALEVHPIKYGSGWAIGGFFVPFLNLVRPMQVMREVWHGSNPANFQSEPGGGPLFGGHESTPVLIGWWWGLFVASGLINNAVVRLSMGGGQDPWHLQWQSGLEALAYAIEIPGAVVAVFLVRRVTAWQSERAALVATTRTRMTALGVVGASGFEPLTPAV